MWYYRHHGSGCLGNAAGQVVMHLAVSPPHLLAAIPGRPPRPSQVPAVSGHAHRAHLSAFLAAARPAAAEAPVRAWSLRETAPVVRPAAGSVHCTASPASERADAAPAPLQRVNTVGFTAGAQVQTAQRRAEACAAPRPWTRPPLARIHVIETHVVVSCECTGLRSPVPVPDLATHQPPCTLSATSSPRHRVSHSTSAVLRPLAASPLRRFDALITDVPDAPTRAVTTSPTPCMHMQV